MVSCVNLTDVHPILLICDGALCMELHFRTIA